MSERQYGSEDEVLAALRFTFEARAEIEELTGPQPDVAAGWLDRLLADFECAQCGRDVHRCGVCDGPVPHGTAVCGYCSGWLRGRLRGA